MARDPPSYDSGIPLPEAVAKIMMDKIGARRAREEYEKGTIAGDDLKAFRDKYRFLPHRETETNLQDIWAAMQRAAYYKALPSDYIKRKAAFQQYKDANTNWKDILLAYRADKIKEWNQDHDTEDHDKEAADVNTVVVGAGEDTAMGETTAEKLRRNKASGNQRPYLGKHQRAIVARAKFKADVKIVATTNKPSDVAGHRP